MWLSQKQVTAQNQRNVSSFTMYSWMEAVSEKNVVLLFLQTDIWKILRTSEIEPGANKGRETRKMSKPGAHGYLRASEEEMLLQENGKAHQRRKRRYQSNIARVNGWKLQRGAISSCNAGERSGRLAEKCQLDFSLHLCEKKSRG